MKIPKTTTDKPYIEFRFDKNGKVKLTATSDWWGGINSGFHSTNGTRGNTCIPKDLDRYMAAYRKREIREIEREMAVLQVKLERLKSTF